MTDGQRLGRDARALIRELAGVPTTLSIAARAASTLDPSVDVELAATPGRIDRLTDTRNRAVQALRAAEQSVEIAVRALQTLVDTGQLLE